MKYRAMKTFMGVGGVVHRRGDEVELSGAADRGMLSRGLLVELSDEPASGKKSLKPHGAGDKKPADDKEKSK